MDSSPFTYFFLSNPSNSSPVMEKFGYGHDGIYRSLRRPLLLPKDPNLSMVSFLFRNSNLYPDKPALIDADSGEILTFSRFKSTVAKVSQGLLQIGIKKNDVVLIFAPNSIQFPVSFFSVIATGAIATTVNPMYTGQELSKQIKDCSPKLIITVIELWEKVKGFDLHVVLLGSGNSVQTSSRVTLFTDLVKNSGSVSDLPNVEIKRNDTTALLYSFPCSSDHTHVFATASPFNLRSESDSGSTICYRTIQRSYSFLYDVVKSYTSCYRTIQRS